MKPFAQIFSNRVNAILPVFVFVFVFGFRSYGQNIAITDQDGYNPHASAMLDVNSTTKGFLLPRLTTVQMNAITTPSMGLMVFNTTDNNIYLFNGTSWINLLSLGVSAMRSPNGTYPNAIIVDNSGRIGISQLAPAARLHINPYGTGADSHIRLEYSATEFGNIYYDAQGMKLRTRGTGDYFSFLNSLGNTSMVVLENGSVGIGNTAPTARLDVKGDNTIPLDTALFSVKSKSGQTIFAVYEEGVRIYIPDAHMKGGKAGFAVGGRTPGKGTAVNYMLVTPDSVRIWVPDTTAKGGKGGFAVGGRTPGKGITANIMNITKQNYFIGHQSGISTTGLYNAFLGFQAGKANTTGTGDVFIGYQSGMNNTIGAYNTFIGYQTGYSNTQGGYNVLMGYAAGLGTTTGSYNSIIGYQAGYTNGYGNYNTFFGYHAGYSCGGSSYNTAIGYESGYSLTNWQGGTYVGYLSGKYSTGRGNTTMGTQAGERIRNGEFNVLIGSLAGTRIDASYNDGSSNVFIGRDAGFNFGSGSYNVGVGHNTGNGATGSYNTLLGAYAGTNSTGSRNVMIGYEAGYGEVNSDKLYIENTNGDATTSLIYGDFAANQLRFNANVGINAAPTNSKFYSYDERTTTVDYPAVYGEHDLVPYYGIGVQGSGGYIGVYGYATVSGTGTRYGVYGAASGGTTNYAGYFAGDLAYTGSLLNFSDENLKTNVKQIDNALEKILLLRGVTFNWKKENEITLKSMDTGKEKEMKSKFNFPEGEQVGVIAQEVENVLPALVHTDENGVKSVDYVKLTPVLIEAIKSQQKLIIELEKRLDRLEQMNKLNKQ